MALPLHAPQHRPDDHALVGRVRAGDVVAFDELFEVYWAPLCRFADGYLRDEGAAKDVVADVLANVWVQRATWNVQTTIAVYLYAAVRHRLVNLRRHVSRREAHYALLLDGESPGLSETPAAMPDHWVESNEQREILDQVLATLPVRWREILRLRWHEQLSWAEIATVLGLSPAAATMQHARALKVLRERLPGSLK